MPNNNWYDIPVYNKYKNFTDRNDLKWPMLFLEMKWIFGSLYIFYPGGAINLQVFETKCFIDHKCRHILRHVNKLLSTLPRQIFGDNYFLELFKIDSPAFFNF